MKKIFYYSAVAIVLLMIVSCSGKKVEVRVFVEYRVSGFPEGDTIRDLLSKPANGTGTQVQVSDNLSQA